MVEYVPVNITWEGEIPIDDLILNIKDKLFSLPDEYESKRESVLKLLEEKDPNYYNGTIMLANITYNPEPLITIQPIKYVDFKALHFYRTEYTDQLFQNWGAFCAVYLILDEDNNHILTGQRTPIGEWGDGSWACPGGLLQYEPSDIDKMLLGELREEINSEIEFAEFNLIGIIESRNHRFSNLVISAKIIDDIDYHRHILTNYEFVNQSLEWKEVNNMIALDDEKLFGDIRFLKYSHELLNR